jgi:hypothetical protein
MVVQIKMNKRTIGQQLYEDGARYYKLTILPWASLPGAAKEECERLALLNELARKAYNIYVGAYPLFDVPTAQRWRMSLDFVLGAWLLDAKLRDDADLKNWVLSVKANPLGTCEGCRHERRHELLLKQTAGLALWSDIWERNYADAAE